MKDKLQALKDHLCDLGYEDAIVFDDKAYVDAYIGMSSDGRPVYSYDKMVECLIEEDDMTYEEAVEWIEYNTIRALPYYPNGPIVLYDDPEYMWKDDDGKIETDEKPTGETA